MAKIEDEILQALRREIARHDKPENKHNYQRFHKEKLKDPMGLKAPVLRSISKQCFKELKGMSAPEVLAICDRLLASGERYMRFFAFEWALNVRAQYRKLDFTQFEKWLSKYVDNWGSCDHLCTGPIGNLVRQYPELTGKIKKCTKSNNRWLRRASAVSLIVPVRSGLILDEVFKTADILLVDADDMVQKGYGWMLKEASNVFPREVFAYVMSNKDRMPRTALRYAIEKLPATMRKQAMK